MQELGEEVDCTPLRPLQTLLLLRIAGVATSREAVGHAREVNVLPLDASLWQSLQSVCLQLVGVGEVVLGSKNLNRHLDGVDLGLVEQRWVGGGDCVDERRVSGELEACPAAVAEAHSGDLAVLLLELLRAGLHLGPSDFLAVAANECHEIEVFGFLGVGHRVRVYDFAIEAA